MNLTLPWPPPTLSPNRRVHWARLAKAKAAYRYACRIETLRLTTAKERGLPTGQLLLSMEFAPPDRRSYDRDNLLARCKAGLDGMCDALGIDDRRFASVTVRVGEPVAGGMVWVTIAREVTP